MDTIFMNSKNSKTSDPRWLLLNLSDKTNLKRNYETVGLSNLSIYYTLKDVKKLYKNYRFKISVPVFWLYHQKIHEAVTHNPSIRIYVNKIEHRITLKIKTRHYL